MSLFHKAERICPNCGMSVPEDNLFCEACGTRYEKPEKAPSPAAGLYCPNGHPVESSEYAFCVICGAKLVSTPAEEIELPAYEKPTPAPAATWICTQCGGVNEEENSFCISCGTPKGSVPPAPNPAPVVKVPAAEEVVIPVRTSPASTLPDIPDIMRPLTNSDMKR